MNTSRTTVRTAFSSFDRFILEMSNPTRGSSTRKMIDMLRFERRGGQVAVVEERLQGGEAVLPVDGGREDTLRIPADVAVWRLVVRDDLHPADIVHLPRGLLQRFAQLRHARGLAVTGGEHLLLVDRKEGHGQRVEELQLLRPPEVAVYDVVLDPLPVDLALEQLLQLPLRPEVGGQILD